MKAINMSNSAIAISVIALVATVIMAGYLYVEKNYQIPEDNDLVLTELEKLKSENEDTRQAISTLILEIEKLKINKSINNDDLKDLRDDIRDDVDNLEDDINNIDDDFNSLIDCINDSEDLEEIQECL